MTDPAGWFDEPMRFLQLNLVEDDGLGTDVESWVAFFERARVDGLTISAGGAIAYYPTDVPLHPRAGFPESEDLFERMCLAAKRAGVRVLARFEAQFTEPEVFAARPDWFRRGPDGQPTNNMDLIDGMHRIRRPGASLADSDGAFHLLLGEDQYMPCWNGGYYREFLPQVMTELADRYPIDGFFANGWPQPMSGSSEPTAAIQCHCDTCAAMWKEWPGAEGRPYPIFDDAEDPLWRTYVEFMQHSVELAQRRLLDHAHGLRSGLTFAGCTSAAPSSAIRFRRYPVDLYAQDSQGRGRDASGTSGPIRSAVWQAGQRASLLRAAANGTPAFQIVGGWRVGHEGAPWLRRLSKDPLELTSLLAQAVAKDVRPWCNVASGTVYDRRWMAPLEDFYRWHAAAEPYLRNRRSTARVGVIWSPQSVWRTAASARPSVGDAINGWQMALLRERIPFTFILDEHLSTSDLSALAAVVVPSGTRLHLEHSEALKAYQAGGGSLIVGCGVDLPGVSDGGFGPEAVGPSKARYLSVRADGAAHPLLVGLGDADYIPAGTWLAPAHRPYGHATGHLVPELPFYADKAWYPRGEDGEPLLVAADRMVAFGTDLDSAFGSTVMSELGLVLANSVRHVAQGREASVELVGPGLVDVDAWQGDSNLTVHLVNLTSPDAAGGALRDVVAVGPLRLAVCLPDGGAVERVHLLGHGLDLTWRNMSDRPGWIEVELETLEMFAVVAIDLLREEPL